MSQDWLWRVASEERDLELLPPANDELLESAGMAVGGLPRPLRELLAVSNGLVCRSFRLYSAFDPRLPKKTWESLQRANDPAKTRALGADPVLLRRFLVFADIGSGFGLWDRTDGSIWFEEESAEEIHQTDLSLPIFVETMAKNAE